MIGQTLSHYEILAELGSGGMGVVYRAEDTVLGRQVAVKVLFQDPEPDGERLDRFEREARLLASLNHPNIATIHSLEKDQGTRFLVMELVGGETLARKITRGPMPLVEVLPIFEQIAEGLGAAHAAGVIHRDLKPANVKIAAGGQVKILDFGLAKAIIPAAETGDPSQTLTLENGATGVGIVLGTVPYMSPEQARGLPMDVRTDIWAFGCCLYEALSGRLAFKGQSSADTLARILTEEPDWRSLPEGSPGSVMQLLRRCLHKDPEGRLRHIDEAKGLLEAGFEEPSAQRSSQQSVAVLPFVSLSSDPENEYFADGMTEDVIAQLTKVDGLTVIARSSVMPLKDRILSLREIGDRLGVGALLDGSVRRAGERVRIVVQLVDAKTESPIWSETYDRNLDDIFAIQSDVALQIARALETELSSDVQLRIEKPAAENLAAYRLCVEGRHCIERFTEEGIRKGLGLFGQALRLDPEYAKAHTGTAWAYVLIGMGYGAGVLTPREAYARAKRAVVTALDIDSELGEAHAFLGLVCLVYDYEWVGAEREMRLALELNPGSAYAHGILALLLSALERHDEAIVAARRAQELDPLGAPHSSDLATKYLRNGRYEDAVREARRLIDLEPEFPMAHSTLGWALIRTGRAEEGLAELRHAVDAAPGNTMFLAQLGQAYAEQDRRQEAQDILHRLTGMSRERHVSPYHLAYVHTGLGDHDRAVECLEEAFDGRASGLYGVKGSFLFRPLHGHPGFQALLQRMGLEA